MNFITGVTILNIGLLLLTGFVFYMSRSPLAFLILILMLGVRTMFEVKCPKCGEEFKPFWKDEEKSP